MHRIKASRSLQKWYIVIYCTSTYSIFCSDRLRTSVNIAGDGFGAGIVAHLCRGLLRRQSQAQLALSPSSQQFGASNASDGESNNSNGGNGGGTGAIALSKQESVAGGLGEYIVVCNCHKFQNHIRRSFDQYILVIE